MKLNYIEKIPFVNQISITLDIGPTNLAFWNNVDFSSMLSLSGVSAL